MILLVCPVFSYIPAIRFTRDELLDIWKYTPLDISPDFVYSDVMLDIVVGGAAVLFRRFRTCRLCTDVTVLKKMFCSDLETFFINCKPFYLPREFCSFIHTSLYIPPQAHVSSALQKLVDLITDTEQQHPDSVLIVLGDFKKAHLSCELPKYRQHVTCPTRDSNILDYCYTTNKESISLCTTGNFGALWSLPGSSNTNLQAENEIC